MTEVTVSPKYQIVIPKAIRESMKIKPGQKLMVLETGEHLEIVPVQDIRKLRGIVKGIDTKVIRDKDRL